MGLVSPMRALASYFRITSMKIQRYEKITEWMGNRIVH
jgi:hypothetical protein